MRAQFFDGFNFNDRKYSIVAIERPEELFSIKDVPIRPTMFDESCIRGWSAIYTLSDGKQLILSRLFTNNGDEPAPALYGVEPVSFHSPAGDLQYNLNLSLTYTGSFLIAYDLFMSISCLSGFNSLMPSKRYLSCPSKTVYILMWRVVPKRPANCASIMNRP